MFQLLPAAALEDVVKVFTYGAGKYDPRNWESGIAWGRVFGAVMRHLWAFWRGEDADPETGLPHLAHAVAGCLFLLTFMRTHKELDDRSVHGALIAGVDELEPEELPTLPTPKRQEAEPEEKVGLPDGHEYPSFAEVCKAVPSKFCESTHCYECPGYSQGPFA
nr:hypothetical protein 13 [Deltaproteobacteria bacterium]